MTKYFKRNANYFSDGAQNFHEPATQRACRRNKTSLSDCRKNVKAWESLQGFNHAINERSWTGPPSTNVHLTSMGCSNIAHCVHLITVSSGKITLIFLKPISPKKLTNNFSYPKLLWWKIYVQNNTVTIHTIYGICFLILRNVSFTSYSKDLGFP